MLRSQSVEAVPTNPGLDVPFEVAPVIREGRRAHPTSCHLGQVRLEPLRHGRGPGHKSAGLLGLLCGCQPLSALALRCAGRSFATAFAVDVAEINLSSPLPGGKLKDRAFTLAAATPAHAASPFSR